MKKKQYLTKSLIILLWFAALSSCAQNSSKIAGSYKFEGQLLIINPDNTCFVFAENAMVKGIVEMKDNTVTIKPYVSKVPFVLYGRKSESRTKGNTLMLQSFNEEQTLINFDENNSSLTKMKRVFNIDANCIDYPNVLDNPNENTKFYFTIEGKKEIYQFDNYEGYRDFIVLYLPQKNENLEMNLTLNTNKDKLIYMGGILEKSKDEISKEELDQVIGMYNRAYSESDTYYCNPAYNFFETEGINVNSGQYKKEEYAGAYYFIDKYNELGDEKDYKNTSKIYEYKKVKATVLTDKTYSIDNKSVFNFKCD